MPAKIPQLGNAIGITKDRPMLGMMLMLGFCIMAPVGDALSKTLGQTMPLLMIVTGRFLLQAIILLPIVKFSNRAFKTSKRVFYLTVLRTVLHVIGVGSMYLSLQYLPLADAIAIAFVMPFIMLLLGRFVLNEEVGSHRMIACAVGFIGTLLVIQPSFAEVGYPALLPLVVAVDFALFMLVTRQIAKDIDPISLQALSGIMASVLLLSLFIMLVIFGDIQNIIITPNYQEVKLLLYIGVLGTIAHLFMTWSLRYAPSATLAPMQYLEIPFATVIGYWMFSDLPNGLAAIGILITIGAGLYVVYREQLTGRVAKELQQDT